MLYLWVLFLYIFLWTSYFQCLRDQEHILGPLELNLQRICKPPCKCKELNPTPLEKQLMLLTSKLFYLFKQQNRRLDQNGSIHRKGNSLDTLKHSYQDRDKLLLVIVCFMWLSQITSSLVLDVI